MTEEEFSEIIRFAERHPLKHYDFSGDEIILGNASDLPEKEHENLLRYLKLLSPWRKGPFNIFGHRIDANWKSNLKWDRIAEFTDDLSGKRIADVGCNNGYYMFRMLPYRPEWILGLDPVVTFRRKHVFFKTLGGFPALQFEQKGFEALENYREEFDVIFSMGILYHHTDPMEILRLMYASLKKGGQAVIETLGYLPGHPGTYALSDGAVKDIYNARIHPMSDAEKYLTSEVSLVPRKRYAGMKSVWNVPSPGAVKNWISRTGFKEIILENIHRYDCEQNLTEWCGMPGLTEMLDQNPDFTREGYPAPVRIYFSARK